jgi:hypothetical protein
MIRAKRKIIERSAAAGEGEADSESATAEGGNGAGEIRNVRIPAELSATALQARKMSVGKDRPAIDCEQGLEQAQTMQQPTVSGSDGKTGRIDPLAVVPDARHAAEFKMKSGIEAMSESGIFQV